MSSEFTAYFLEDNFLSEDDWGSCEHEDLSSFNIENGFEQGFTNIAQGKTNDGELSTQTVDKATVGDHESFLHDSSGAIDHLIVGLDSPPLTPSNEELSSYSSNSCDVQSVDDILAELANENGMTTQFNSNTFDNMDALYGAKTGLDDITFPGRGRSQSSESSSSTSAYSSQPSTPPPLVQHLTPTPLTKLEADVFDQVFVSASNHSEKLKFQSVLSTTDEGFCEKKHHRVMCGTVGDDIRFKEKKTLMKARKNPSPKQNAKADPRFRSDFDRKVEEALRETNRLLNLHNMKPAAVEGMSESKPVPVSSTPSYPATNASIATSPTIDLKKLCDKVILSEGMPTTTVCESTAGCNASAVSRHDGTNLGYRVTPSSLGEKMKRKASERPQKQYKKMLIATESASTPSPTIPLVASGNIPLTVCPNRSGAEGYNMQIPLKSIDSSLPMRIIVKSEPGNSGICLTSGLPKVATGSTTTPTTSMLRVSTNPIQSVQMVGNVSSPTFAFNQIPSRTEQSVTSSSISSQPGVTIASGRHPVVKLYSDVGKQTMVPTTRNPHKLLPSVDNHIMEVAAEVSTSSTSKVTSKPLMGSICGPKKPIVPAMNFNNALSPSSSLLSCSSYPFDASANCYPDSALLSKRHQRMIKNRESACQSRQRKKEYVNALEHQMQEFIHENKQLREQNLNLRKRISDLEEENVNLRQLTSVPLNGQKKVACFLMFAFLVAFNVQPLSFLASKSIPVSSDGAAMKSDNSTGRSNLLNPVPASYHGRQLLSHEDQNLPETSIDIAKLPHDGAVIKSPLGVDPGRSRQFWVDDLVKDCKKRHFGRIQEVLQDTASISLQRLLRRKLKEELGIRIPLNVPRIRRIAYGGAAPLAYDRSSEPVPPDDFMTLDAKINKAPQPAPFVKKLLEGGSKVVVPSCDHPERNGAQTNETDWSRVSDDLAQWIQRHKKEQKLHKEKPARKKSKVESTPPSPANKDDISPVNETYRSAVNDKTGVALYQKRDDKLQRLLETINRRNDTVYVITFNQEYILLPAMTRNQSRLTKMALVLPTAAPNDSFSNDGSQQTMIQIHCDVIATEYFSVKRDTIPVDVASKQAMERKLSGRKSDLLLSSNPKRQAFHGSGRSNSKKTFKGKVAPSGDDDATVADVVDL